jgi:hypothetical protein
MADEKLPGGVYHDTKQGAAEITFCIQGDRVLIEFAKPLEFMEFSAPQAAGLATLIMDCAVKASGKQPHELLDELKLEFAKPDKVH